MCLYSLLSYDHVAAVFASLEIFFNFLLFCDATKINNSAMSGIEGVWRRFWRKLSSCLWRSPWWRASPACMHFSSRSPHHLFNPTRIPPHLFVSPFPFERGAAVCVGVHFRREILLLRQHFSFHIQLTWINRGVDFAVGEDQCGHSSREQKNESLASGSAYPL